MTQTIALLQTCDAGVKTAVNSLENALRKTQDEGLRRQLQRSLAEHRALGSELKQALEAEQAGGKPPSAMARVMAQGKMNLRYAFLPSDATVAELVWDGCAMGARTVCREENRRRDADHTAHDLARRITDVEHRTARSLEPYL